MIQSITSVIYWEWNTQPMALKWRRTSSNFSIIGSRSKSNSLHWNRSEVELMDRSKPGLSLDSFNCRFFLIFRFLNLLTCLLTCLQSLMKNPLIIIITLTTATYHWANGWHQTLTWVFIKFQMLSVCLFIEMITMICRCVTRRWIVLDVLQPIFPSAKFGRWCQSVQVIDRLVDFVCHQWVAFNL